MRLTREQIASIKTVYSLACDAPLSEDASLAKRQQAAKEEVRAMLYGKRAQ